MHTDDLPKPRRMPSSGELRSILETYFVGVISEEQLENVERLLHEVFEDQEKHVRESNQFYGNSQVWAGRQFMEEERVPRTPRVVDMACVVAARVLGLPKLKPYCPDHLVGTWQDERNPAVRWELGGDGAFRTDQPEYKGAIRWYVVRRADLIGDVIRLAEQWGDPKKLHVVSTSPSELVLEYAAKPERKHVLRRA